MSVLKNFLIKKKVKKFTRYHSDRYKRIKSNWRKPKGIDSCIRRRFKGKPRMPSIGYANNRKTKNKDFNGFLKVRIFNVRDLDILLLSNQKYAGEIAKHVGKKKRKDIIRQALKMDVRITNKLMFK